MYILGISAFYHDSATVLISNGEIICAIEEERLTRIKHDNQFPLQAIQKCLKDCNLGINDIDCIAYYEKPLLKFERILQTFVETYPFSLKPFLKAIPDWIGQKIKVEQIIRKDLDYKGKIYFSSHHLSHAAAAFYPSPFKNSAILTADGVGEYQTTALWRGQDKEITSLKSINFPHSLGLLYSTFTSFLGFKVNEDEYKVMGLAAYGKPTFVDDIYKLLEVKEDGSFELNMKYFSFRESFQMWSKAFENLFGNPRKPTGKVTTRDENLAVSIQTVTEEIYFKILNHLYQLTKTKNLCISGGVALNALANGKIYHRTPFKKVYVFGAAGDSGGALGAALLINYHAFNGNPKTPINNLSLGSTYSNGEIKEILKEYKLKYEFISDEDELVEKVAFLLAKDKIIGWFQGKMEFGPRALGARSILANPKPSWMKNKVNIVKRRELFRPFAGSILQSKVDEYFKVPEKNYFSPFMTFCFQATEKGRENLSAIVHEDNSCRIQTVNIENGRYFKLIQRFYKITGIPCILNTSFNLKGEPIVENPKQAIKDFLRTKMDALIIENYFILKSTYKRKFHFYLNI